MTTSSSRPAGRTRTPLTVAPVPAVRTRAAGPRPAGTVGTLPAPGHQVVGEPMLRVRGGLPMSVSRA